MVNQLQGQLKLEDKLNSSKSGVEYEDSSESEQEKAKYIQSSDDDSLDYDDLKHDKYTNEYRLKFMLETEDSSRSDI